MLRRRDVLKILLGLGAAPVSAVGSRFHAFDALAYDQALSPSAVDSRASSRLSIGDFPRGALQSADKIQRRFEIYHELGIGMLRTLVRWADVEQTQGVWGEPVNLRHLRMAKEAGLRFRMVVSTLGSPPEWFREAHPDALIRNQNGETDKNDVSPWYPQIRPILAEATDNMFRKLRQWDLWDTIDYILIDSGPAAEPVYPPFWGLTPGHTRANSTFWFFDPHSRSHFIQHMQDKYREITSANHAWGSNYGSWNEVGIPAPGTAPGPMWRDVLNWYRDSKRELIAWQVENYKEKILKHAVNGHIPHAVLLDSGSHFEPGELAAAERSGDGDWRVKLMPDIEFIVDLAARTGCWLQYPGSQDARELDYISNYMRSKGLAIPMWGENAGGPPAYKPEHLADLAIQFHLYGLEFNNAGAIFEGDGVTPNANFPAFADACRRLRQFYRA